MELCTVIVYNLGVVCKIVSFKDEATANKWMEHHRSLNVKQDEEYDYESLWTELDPVI